MVKGIQEGEREGDKEVKRIFSLPFITSLHSFIQNSDVKAPPSADQCPSSYRKRREEVLFFSRLIFCKTEIETERDQDL